MTSDPKLIEAITLFATLPANLTDAHLATLATVDPAWRDRALERRAIAKAASAKTGKVNAMEWAAEAIGCVAGLAARTIAEGIALREDLRASTRTASDLREELRALNVRILELEADRAARAAVEP